MINLRWRRPTIVAEIEPIRPTSPACAWSDTELVEMLRRAAVFPTSQVFDAEDRRSMMLEAARRLEGRE